MLLLIISEKVLKNKQVDCTGWGISSNYKARYLYLNKWALWPPIEVSKPLGAEFNAFVAHFLLPVSVKDCRRKFLLSTALTEKGMVCELLKEKIASC